MNSPLLQLPNTFRTFYGAFPALHPIQEQAIRPVLDNRDLIIQSATGSGKTEAVLAPCLERIISSGLTEAALYIVPTRALAFDIQRRFVSVLRERLGIHFAIRTGDLKRSGGGRPDIMLTTPESLDVMLGSANVDLRGFLQRVSMVIIDEVHPLIHQYRGWQLVYLLHRLERRIGKPLQKIALSATIADPAVVGSFLHLRPDFVLLTESVKRRILPRLLHLKNDENELVNLLGDLFREWKYRKILIFANSRGRCDKIFSVLNHQGPFKGAAELHYSNLNARERQAIEKRFRRRSCSVCIATSTLELGIDVGDVDAVILFEPPDSVSAFLQRIGRANRRQDTIHFWGICRGERAPQQLLRFLALLQLAREGRVESPLPKLLPSVLSQQLVSCLYEKKRLSLKSLQGLFSGPSVGSEAGDVKEIFNSLRRKKWLKKTAIPGLYAGGWFYWDALVEHRIWSNFPESEQDYSLEVSGNPVADIPQSMVKQFDPGDHVLLAGQRLRIISIDEGKHKRVVAEPSKRPEGKELSWWGLGGYVSYEVAQAMRLVLKSTSDENHDAVPGLFSRTRKLIRQELEKDKSVVTLENGIEVRRAANGLYCYRTFIGTVGNLVLAWSVREAYADLGEDVQVAADEIGLSCSRLIDFKLLALPLSDDDLVLWVERHFKMLRAMFPLNVFCCTLSKELLLRELTSFIRDSRLIDFFQRCHNKSSEIIHGDPKNLDLWPRSVNKNNEQQSLPNIPAQGEPLLTWEKKRRVGRVVPACHPEAGYQVRALTGSLVGSYFRHHQCRRWLCFHFLPPEAQPLCRYSQVDEKLAAGRRARGREWEEKVFFWLNNHCQVFSRIAAKDVHGREMPLKDRVVETVEQLHMMMERSAVAADSYIYLVQPALQVDNLLSPAATFFNHRNNQKITLPGVGIPSLIRRAAGEENLLEVGDVKSSRQPRYDQKWQVAFYAFLLQKLVRCKPQFSQLKVADKGFLLLPPSGCDQPPESYTFALHPYFASFKALFAQFQTSLGQAPMRANWQLRKQCPDCPYFEFCYDQALQGEEVQFIPRLSGGLLQKMRSSGMKRLDPDMPLDTSFNPRQRAYLKGTIDSLDKHHITIVKQKTDWFPANISTRFFVHLVNDPVSGLPRGVVLGMMKRGGTLETITWTAFSAEERLRVWQEFSSLLLEVWPAAVQNGRGPHLFLFGNETRRGMSTWAAMSEDVPLGAIFQSGIDAYCTDIQEVFFDHFLLPLPGVMTLFALNRFLGLLDEATLDVPESLFHADWQLKNYLCGDEGEVDRGDRDRLKNYLERSCRLIMKLEQWIEEHLESEWQREDWRIIPSEKLDWSAACRKFIEVERLQRERELRDLQELSLAERVERFRALGPLRFTGTTLDDEGRFLHLFSLVDHQPGVTKFRPGDFLRLVPCGVCDLQSGMPVLLVRYDVDTGQVALSLRLARNRGAPQSFSSSLTYSLEEDGEDFHSARLLEVVEKGFSDHGCQPVIDLFNGTLDDVQPSVSAEWLPEWLCSSEGRLAALNSSQQQALSLPFHYVLSLISGPPGSGKTNLLGWILIALVRQAQTTGAGLKIVVSAVTHQAIDQVLNKVVGLVNAHNLADFPARCVKWGRWEGEMPAVENQHLQVEVISHARDAEDVLLSPYLIVGATGYGLRAMLGHGCTNGGSYTKFFDWVVFDEASQMLTPQAMLSLVHGKGNFIFLGDTCQLPPVIRSSIFKEERGNGSEYVPSVAAESRCSVLDILLRRYPRRHRQLEVTYRMNAEICRFPSRRWYGGRLQPAVENSRSRLSLTGVLGNDLFDRIIDPEKPVVLVEMNHQGCVQESAEEAGLLSHLAGRLLQDYGIKKEQMAIISPHRAQNNAISRALSLLLGGVENLPVIDTVERLQGAERDVVLFGFTCSDSDLVLSEFLNNPQRFNVAITRARQKLIVVGSKTFFETVANSEKQLQANACFKDFFEFCREQNGYFKL